MAFKKHQINPNNWVNLYADYLFNYTISRVNNVETAKDLVQETFFAALKAMENFQGNATERTWLIAILKRKIVDYYRKINSAKGKAEIKINFYAEGKREGEWIEENIPSYWETNIEKTIENKELAVILKKCIENLPEKYAMVFNMKTIEEMETKEICKELAITPSNFWVLIHRARMQLRKCMEENWFKI